MNRSKHIDDGPLYCRESIRYAMAWAAWYWPGVSISDGAFDLLNQVAEYRKKPTTPSAEAR